MMHQGSDRCCGAWCYRLISAGWRGEGAACHQRSSAAHPHVIKGVEGVSVVCSRGRGAEQLGSLSSTPRLPECGATVWRTPQYRSRGACLDAAGST